MPLHGSELDTALMRTEPRDLVDLPLRDRFEAAPSPVAVPVAAPALASAGPRTPTAPKRRRIGRAIKMGVAAAMLGAVVVGGWFVHAPDRVEPEETVLAEARTPTSAPAAAVPSITRPAPAAATAPARVASRTSAPLSSARVSPAAHRTTVAPAAAPVDVERARDDLRHDSKADAHDGDARAELRARLDRAEQRRETVVERVSQLRARTNVPVIKDIEKYQRLQEQLSAALDQLDRADAEIARLRRTIGRGGE